MYLHFRGEDAPQMLEYLLMDTKPCVSAEPEAEAKSLWLQSTQRPQVRVITPVAAAAEMS